MNKEKWSIDELETMYMTEYDESDLDEDMGDDVENFLNWCRTHLSHLN